jgi:ribosomal RNA-processing protein 9
MSFFVREKRISNKTKKVMHNIISITNIQFKLIYLQFTNLKRNLPQKRNEDEELDSENEEINGNYKSHPDISDEEDYETPDAKRLRLAKQYLNEIKKSDDEDEHVTQKLKFDYLESVGKLKKFLADDIVGYDVDNIVKLKHKLQHQSITCLCLLPNDDNIFFSGSKTGKVLKWDIQKKNQIGSFALNSHIMCIAISSDSKFLAVSDKSRKIFIYNPITLEKLHTFEGHRGVVTGIAIRKDTHQMFSCSEDRSVKVWSLDEMVYVETL